MHILADRFAGGDEVLFKQLVQQAQLVIAIKAGELVQVRQLVEEQGASVNNDVGPACLSLITSFADSSI